MLIVEDGTRVPGANTYASLATVTAYHVARGNAGWLHSSEDAEPAILRAMDWLESQLWHGRPYVGPVGGAGGQSLQWPRADVYDANGDLLGYDDIPPQVLRALCEAALIELEDAGALAPTLERGGMVKREKVDVIETEYMDGAPVATVHTVLRQALRGLVRGGGSIQLVRG